MNSSPFPFQVKLILRIKNIDACPGGGVIIHYEERKMTRKMILKHSEMCIDYNYGTKLIDKQNVGDIVFHVDDFS